MSPLAKGSEATSLVALSGSDDQPATPRTVSRAVCPGQGCTSRLRPKDGHALKEAPAHATPSPGAPRPPHSPKAEAAAGLNQRLLFTLCANAVPHVAETVQLNKGTQLRGKLRQWVGAQTPLGHSATWGAVGQGRGSSLPDRRGPSTIKHSAGPQREPG